MHSKFHLHSPNIFNPLPKSVKQNWESWSGKGTNNLIDFSQSTFSQKQLGKTILKNRVRSMLFQPRWKSLCAEFCASLEIPFTSHEVDIAGAIRNQDGKKACFTCSYFRRGAINRYAKEHGMNKIAYAHHHDDAVETFFMSLLYSGQLTTFLPVTYLDRTGLTVIRPLIYFREKEIQDAEKYHGCTPVPSPCPLDGKTIRQTTKELIAALSKDNPLLYTHLASAMRKSSLGELWPAAKTRDEMRETYHNLHAVLRRLSQ